MTYFWNPLYLSYTIKIIFDVQISIRMIRMLRNVLQVSSCISQSSFPLLGHQGISFRKQKSSLLVSSILHKNLSQIGATTCTFLFHYVHCNNHIVLSKTKHIDFGQFFLSQNTDLLHVVSLKHQNTVLSLTNPICSLFLIRNPRGSSRRLVS